MQIVLKQLFLLYIFLLAGWILGRVKKEKAAHGEVLSLLLVNVFLPCKVFRAFANNFTVAYFTQKYALVLASLVLLALLAIGARFLPRLLTSHPYERRVYSYSVAITNYAYLGYVLIEAVFGEAVLADFMFFAIPFIIYTYTVGYATLTGGRNPAKRLCNPITVAIVLGMAVGLSGLPIPEILASVVSMGSGCVGPLSMLLTGMTLATFSLRELLSDKTAYVFCVLRLAVIPSVVYLLCRGLRLGTVLPMAVMITCMPCGLNTIVFPRLVGEDCKPGARLAFITHALSLITLPIWLSLIQ